MIKNMSLQVKLVMSFVAMILLVFGLNFYIYSQIGMMISSMDQAYESNIQITMLQNTLRSMQDDLYAYLNGEYDSLKGYYSNRNALETQIYELNNDPSYNRTSLIEKNIRNLAETYLALAEEAVSGHRGTDIEQYSSSYERAKTVYGYLETNIYTLNNETFTANTNKYEMLSEVQKYTQMLNMMLLLFVSLIEILIIIYMTGKFIGPLSSLAERAREVGHGKMDMPPLEVKSQDEVGQVTSAFNRMVVRLNEHIRLQQEQLREENRLKQEQLQLETFLKDSQLGALQAQINPHFLYNTLNAGSQLAMIEDAEQTSIFLEHVADYFRYNLHRAGNDVSLQEELLQVENYIFIMNTRFAGDIHFEKDMPEKLPEARLPGMILQPIVENAIDHGLRVLEDREKRLVISVEDAGDVVVVTVADNGDGFPEKKAQELLENKDRSLHTSKDNMHGIGMANVISRLRLFYDRDDVIEIGTMPDGTGTEVRILIPVTYGEK